MLAFTMLCFFLQSSHVLFLTSAAASNGQSPASNLLELNVGLNLSIIKSFSFSGVTVVPISQGLMFTAAIAAYGENAVFLPILSSPGFNSTNSSNSLGFSVGFLVSGFSTSNIYLAVCGGLSGNYSNSSSGNYLVWGSGDDASVNPELVADGYVVPVWIANLDSPLRSVKSSLVVVTVSNVGGAGSSSNELQLRDHDGTLVWRVSNVSMMEMLDNGNLVIYDSTNHVVWQSSTQPRDTLLQGQMLTVGKELTSNDSSYLARMEKGGLVLYAANNNAQFIQQPSPYWVFPIILYYDPGATDLLDLNTLVLSPRCSSPNDTAYSTLGNSSLQFFLKPGSCASNTSFYLYSEGFSLIDDWSFVKLAKDGRLYTYAVDSGTSPPSISQQVLDQLSWLEHSRAIIYLQMPFSSSLWGECNVPMACGPLGLCSQGAETVCACPNPSREGLSFFNPNDPNNLSKGCTRSTSLPPCGSGNEHIHTTDFLQLNHTASIFLFSGWAYNSTVSTPAPVEKCKQACSSNCSCNGFIYQVNTSACFFITNEISLLNVTDQNLTYFNWVNNSGTEVALQEIFASNYVTYLKVASSTSANITYLKVTSAASSTSSKHANAMIAIAVLSSSLVCLVLAGLAVYYLFSAIKSKRRNQASQAEEEEELRDILPVLPSRFSYQDLHIATNSFSKLLGEGGCGSVYAGVLPDGRKIAVKVLKYVLKAGHSKQFLAEVATIGRTSHYNIVRLVGFCWEVSNRLLVYEYMEKGSLDHWLFVKLGAEPPPMLDWKTRYNVALGIARGLSYLHEDCPQPILHFDIKPQNILLDSEFVAKLADFGMSRLMQRDVSAVVTGVRGTPGYIAPEWMLHGSVSKKSDVYSMGMVMLEIVGGRRNLELALLNSALDPEEWHFPSWAAKKCEQGLMMELIDKRLQTFDVEQAQRLIHTAFWCVHENPSIRPFAPTVVQWLEGTSLVKVPPFSTAVHALLHPPLDSSTS